MYRILSMGALSGVLLLGSGIAQAKLAGDPVAGQKIYQANCLSCHGSEVFTRADRRAKNQRDILVFVQQNCNRVVKKPLNMKDLENVATFLNNKYYKFPN